MFILRNCAILAAVSHVMNPSPETIISSAAFVGLDAVLLMVGMRFLASLRLSFRSVLWISFVACMLTSVIAFGLFHVLANRMVLVMAFSAVLGSIAQAALLRHAARARGHPLSNKTAYSLSLIFLLANFVVVPALIAWGKGLF